jgi:glycosyltransferase involved in cell wall biosynthesis
VVRALSQMADCTVLVAPEHMQGIRSWEERHPGAGLAFIEVPEPRWAKFSKWHRVAWFAVYLVWLRRAHRLAIRLHVAARFDLACHVSYSTYWLPSPAVRLGVPSLWGPVGGAVTTPRSLWPLLGLRGMMGELLDMLSVRVLARLPGTRRTWRDATVRLVQNPATLERLPGSLRDRTRILNHALLAEVEPARTRTPGARVLFIGSLDARKGVKLAIRALAHASETVHLEIVGDGPERPKLQRLAARLGVAHRLHFSGRLPRAQVLQKLESAAAVLFTGLREEGGMALAEAMFAGVPVIVLAHGGARTVAEAAREASMVALIRPQAVDATARAMGDAMTRFVRFPGTAPGPLLDRTAAVRSLRESLDQALTSQGPTR